MKIYIRNAILICISISMAGGCASTYSKISKIEHDKTTPTEENIAKLEKYLYHNDCSVKRQSAGVLVEKYADHPDATATLIKAMESENPKVRSTVVPKCLFHTNQDIHNNALVHINDESVDVRLSVADGLYNKSKVWNDQDKETLVSNVVERLAVRLPLEKIHNPDTNVLNQCESLLIRMSTDSDKRVRSHVGRNLAIFGTKKTLARALAMLRKDKAPETRLDIGDSLLLVLHSWNDKNQHVQESPNGSNGMVILLSHCHARIILPDQASILRIEDAIVNAFLNDDGEFNVKAITRIPFVPFSRREYIYHISLRDEFGEEMAWVFQGNERVIKMLKESDIKEGAPAFKPTAILLGKLAGKAPDPVHYTPTDYYWEEIGTKILENQ